MTGIITMNELFRNPMVMTENSTSKVLSKRKNLLIHITENYRARMAMIAHTYNPSYLRGTN
jgi:hypothetical protein